MPVPDFQSTAESRRLVREHFERWKTLGPMLDGIRFWELRAMSDTSRIRTLAGLLCLAKPNVDRFPEGWVAWQKVRERWMRKS